MFEINGKYGNIHIKGKTIDIDKVNVDELEIYLNELETNRMKLIENQNEYISELIK